MKALSVEVMKYKGKSCANGGISDKFNDVLLICDEGNIEVNGDEPNLMELVKRNLWGEEHWFVRPVTKCNGVGWMSSGSFVWSCDSRFPYAYPLPMHDRTESQELYNQLSQ